MAKAKFEIRDSGLVLMHLPHPTQSARPHDESQFGQVNLANAVNAWLPKHLRQNLCELLEQAFEAGRAERSSEIRELLK